MSTSINRNRPPRPAVEYPDSDGKPIAENTLQFEWIVTIKEGLDALFLDNPDVFVAGDLLWYPVEGHSEISVAPDAMVAFGRPKGYRGSYKQWEEGGIAPQVVFEVLSPGNRAGEMLRKFQLYERQGVEEYYIYDPDHPTLAGWTRVGDEFREIPETNGHVSARLGIRFDMSSGDLRIFDPDDRRFQTYSELYRSRDAESRRADEATRRADLATQRADQERERAEAERQNAEAERQKAEAERQNAKAERERADRLAERLRQLGLESD